MLAYLISVGAHSNASVEANRVQRVDNLVRNFGVYVRMKISIMAVLKNYDLHVKLDRNHQIMHYFIICYLESVLTSGHVNTTDEGEVSELGRVVTLKYEILEQ